MSILLSVHFSVHCPCIIFPLFRFLSFSIHYPFIFMFHSFSFHSCPVVSFHFPFIVLSFSYSFYFLSCSFHYYPLFSCSFHFLSFYVHNCPSTSFHFPFIVFPAKPQQMTKPQHRRLNEEARGYYTLPYAVVHVHHYEKQFAVVTIWIHAIPCLPDEDL